MRDEYDECGNWRGDDNKRADGYECQECGYEPTWAEVHRGSCPKCRETRREERA